VTAAARPDGRDIRPAGAFFAFLHGDDGVRSMQAAVDAGTTERIIAAMGDGDAADRSGARGGEDDTDRAALLRACAGGSRAALHALYEADGPLMLAVARRIVRQREIAEDVVHEAFVNIWRRADSFDPARGSARAWMIAVARNAALNSLRKSARTVATAEPVGAAVVDPAPDPQTVLERLRDDDALRACLEILDEDKRRAILLAYMEGLTHTEIAERTAAPVGTVKSWIRRGLIALRSCLE